MNEDGSFGLLSVNQGEGARVKRMPAEMSGQRHEWLPNSREVKASNGAVVLVEYVEKDYMGELLMPYMKVIAPRELAAMTDEGIVALLVAATEVGKILEWKGFRVEY